MIRFNLQSEIHDCPVIMDKLQDDEYAQKMYAAFCNVLWYKLNAEPNEWTVSWRTAGGIVAELRSKNEDYLDFYCSGIASVDDLSVTPEGTVDPEIIEDLKNLGWSFVIQD